MRTLSRAVRWVPAPRHIALSTSCTALAAFFVLWNLRRSPDTQYDEVAYSRADQAVAQGWHLTWTNRPLFVHPPLSFLVQAGWLRLLGVADRPLIEVITSTRLLAGLVTVADIVLLAMLAYRLMPAVRPRRRTVLTLLTAVLAAIDPVMLRYGRMAMIEAFALLGCLITLHLAIALRERRAAVYVPAVGLATGLTLLTNEVGIFMMLTPLLFALIDRNRSLVWRCGGALIAGLALWFVFSLWAVQLGLFSSFVDIKSVTLQRLLGLVQITGWNRPGVSFLSGITAELGQYLSSYVVLACGALALVWLFVHRGGFSRRWLLAWLLTSYAFGTYTVLLGTLNEQFFVYVIPAPLVATVLVIEAVVGRRTWSTGLALSALGAVLVLSTASWGRFYVTRNDGMARLTAYVDATLPSCAVLNATGDVEQFQLVMPSRPIAAFATGPGALSHGVNLFILSDKDAAMRFGNASPALTSWVRAHGSRLASYPSATYRGLELWQIGRDPYDPSAGVERFPGGDFVITEGSRCGGFPVTDSTLGSFAVGWAQLGGKSVAGAPLTSSWTAGAGAYQVFTGAVLASVADATGQATLATVPFVEPLARAAPAAYRQANLPPITQPSGSVPGVAKRTALLTDRALADAYHGDLARMLGRPLGPATQMPDGKVRQAFAGGVLERAPSSTQVRLAPVGELALNAGLVRPPSQARAVLTPPALPVDQAPAQPTTVEPFVWTLAGALVLYAIASAAIVARRDAGDLVDSVSRGYGPLPEKDVLAALGVVQPRRAMSAVGARGNPARQPEEQSMVSGIGASSPAGPPWTPAMGSLVPVGHRSALARIAMMALLLAVAMAVRTSGALRDEPSTLPALPHAAAVVPGVARCGQPEEADLVRLRDDYGVRAIVAVNGRNDSTVSDIEERAVAQSLGLRFLQLQVPDGAALSPAQTYALLEVLRAMRPSAQTAPNLVLLHDETGNGSVVVVSAMIQILDKQPITSVLDRLPPLASDGLSSAQSTALRQLADAVAGAARSDNPYASLHGSEW